VRVSDEDDPNSAIRHDEWMPAAIEPNQHCVPDACEPRLNCSRGKIDVQDSIWCLLHAVGAIQCPTSQRRHSPRSRMLRHECRRRARKISLSETSLGVATAHESAWRNGAFLGNVEDVSNEPNRRPSAWKDDAILT
jgi:hypothetical protein